MIQTYLIFKTHLLSNQYAIGYVVFCILLGLYVRLLLFGGNPAEGMPKGMFQTHHVISQKLIALMIICATLHQTIGIEKLFNKINK